MRNEHSPIAESILRFNNFVTGETLSLEEMEQEWFQEVKSQTESILLLKKA